MCNFLISERRQPHAPDREVVGLLELLRDEALDVVDARAEDEVLRVRPRVRQRPPCPQAHLLEVYRVEGGLARAAVSACFATSCAYRRCAARHGAAKQPAAVMGTRVAESIARQAVLAANGPILGIALTCDCATRHCSERGRRSNDHSSHARFATTVGRTGADAGHHTQGWTGPCHAQQNAC